MTVQNQPTALVTYLNINSNVNVETLSSLHYRCDLPANGLAFYIKLFQFNDYSKHFATLFTFTHPYKHSHPDARGLMNVSMLCRLHIDETAIGSNLGFSIWADRTNYLPISRRPARHPEPLCLNRTFENAIHLFCTANPGPMFPLIVYVL